VGGAITSFGTIIWYRPGAHIRLMVYPRILPREDAEVPSGAVPAVEVSNLVVKYGPLTAVNGITLEADHGQVVAMLGRNGAGKTTTVETLEGYRKAAAGTTRVLGLDPQRPTDRRQLARRVGVMLQGGGVYPAMGPAEAVHLFASYYDNPVPPDELIRQLGLDGVAGTPWRRLSGGEQQRLSLALALVGRPDVVFLDEPTAGVDPQGRLAIRGQIAALRGSKVCVLLTTHELDEAERVADRIVIIDHGRVVASGTPAELTGSEGFRFAARPALDTTSLSALLRAIVTEEQPGRYLVDGPGSPENLAALTAWMAARHETLNELQTGRDRLEDVFLRLTAREDG
jgi:ABC-2 type transport system ATP-binding protein